MANRAKVPRSKQPPSTVRVIGGAWRGRRIPFLDLEGLRPTPDRVRETLFNWLSAHCPGARVLDAFAGSGVLGLEALSRGAGHVDFIEQSPAMAKRLAQTIEALNATTTLVTCDDALLALKRFTQPFDVVFCDPPYRLGLVEPFLAELLALNLVREGGLVYVERPKGSQALHLSHFAVHRALTAGQVEAILLRCTPQSRD